MSVFNASEETPRAADLEEAAGQPDRLIDIMAMYGAVNRLNSPDQTLRVPTFTSAQSIITAIGLGHLSDTEVVALSGCWDHFLQTHAVERTIFESALTNYTRELTQTVPEEVKEAVVELREVSTSLRTLNSALTPDIQQLKESVSALQTTLVPAVNSLIKEIAAMKQSTPQREITATVPSNTVRTLTVTSGMPVTTIRVLTFDEYMRAADKRAVIETRGGDIKEVEALLRETMALSSTFSTKKAVTSAWKTHGNSPAGEVIKLLLLKWVQTVEKKGNPPSEVKDLIERIRRKYPDGEQTAH